MFYASYELRSLYKNLVLRDKAFANASNSKHECQSALV